MKMFKPALILVVVLLVVSGSGIIANGAASGPALGEKLVRQLWVDMKEENMAALEKKIAPGFQSVHQDGGRDRDQQLKLIKNLKLGKYVLSDFNVTQTGSVIVATYFVSVEETITGKRLSSKPAARLSIFLKTDGGWQWIAHANLKPLK